MKKSPIHANRLSSVRFPEHHEAMLLNEQSDAGIILHFARGLLFIDVTVAVTVELISWFLDLHTLLAYGTLLAWAGVALIVLAAMLVMGGLSSRLQDIGAYNLS